MSYIPLGVMCKSKQQPPPSPCKCELCKEKAHCTLSKPDRWPLFPTPTHDLLPGLLKFFCFRSCASWPHSNPPLRPSVEGTDGCCPAFLWLRVSSPVLLACSDSAAGVVLVRAAVNHLWTVSLVVKLPSMSLHFCRSAPWQIARHTCVLRLSAPALLAPLQPMFRWIITAV